MSTASMIAVGIGAFAFLTGVLRVVTTALRIHRENPSAQVHVDKQPRPAY
jgi:hypothetical protein